YPFYCHTCNTHILFLSHYHCHHPDLHSFPTRRSSDLAGQIWQHESFDHVLRREESIEAKVQYICENPVRAGLVKHPHEYRWLWRSEEHTSELQSRRDLVCRLLLEKKKKKRKTCKVYTI